MRRATFFFFVVKDPLDKYIHSKYSNIIFYRLLTETFFFFATSLMLIYILAKCINHILFYVYLTLLTDLNE